MKPWEKYSSSESSKPWEKYSTKSSSTKSSNVPEPEQFAKLEAEKQQQEVLQKRADFADKNPVIAGLGQTAKDVSTIPAHFINQFLANAPRSAMNTYQQGSGNAPFESASPVAGALANIAGVAGGVVSPLNKLALMKATTLPKMMLGGALAGAAYSPTDNVADVKQRAISAVQGAGIGGAVNRVGTILSPLTKPAAQKIQDAINSSWNSAIKPSTAKMSKAALDKAMESRYNAVRAITQQMPDAPPKSVNEALDATAVTKKAVFDKYDQLAKSVGDDFSIPLAHKKSSVTGELDSLINNKNLATTRPDVVAYAQKMKDSLVSRVAVSPSDAQEMIQQLNAKTKSMWNGVASGTAQISPEAAGAMGVDEMVANNLRKQVDDFIESKTGKNYQELKTTYGALRQMEKELSRASARIANRNKAGLLDFTDVFTGAQLGASLFRGDLAGAVGGGIGRGIKEVMQYMNNPNRHIEKIFKVASRQEKYVGKNTPLQNIASFLEQQKKGLTANPILPVQPTGKVSSLSKVVRNKKGK